MGEAGNSELARPKAFISYSWTTPEHQAQIVEWAEQLMADGVDVVLDLFDLKEGGDTNSFMERMVTDSSVTHVLVFSDAQYAEKAAERRSGVGTESQIISGELYESVTQSKFIPLVCEFDSDGRPHLPVFFKTRKWIDFSSPQAATDGWEKLIRVLYGRPAIVKPSLGKPPEYLIADTSVPADTGIAAFSALRQSLLRGDPSAPHCRQRFFDSCIQYVDELRVRQPPNLETLGEKVLEDCGKLKRIRNHLVDWALLISSGFFFVGRSIWDAMNVDRLGTLG